MTQTAAHPAPLRYRISAWRMALGLCGAPLAWLIQMALSQTIASYACYPHHRPLPTPQFHHLLALLTLITLLCFAVAVFSSVIAVTAWRRTRQEKSETGHVVEIGEGRTRFLVAIAMLLSLLFLVAILFTSCTLFLVSPCQSWIS